MSKKVSKKVSETEVSTKKKSVKKATAKKAVSKKTTAKKSTAKKVAPKSRKAVGRPVSEAKMPKPNLLMYKGSPSIFSDKTQAELDLDMALREIEDLSLEIEDMKLDLEPAMSLKDSMEDNNKYDENFLLNTSTAKLVGGGLLFVVILYLLITLTA